MNLLIVGGRQRFLVAHHFGMEGGQKKPCPPYHKILENSCTGTYSKRIYKIVDENVLKRDSN